MVFINTIVFSKTIDVSSLPRVNGSSLRQIDACLFVDGDLLGNAILEVFGDVIVTGEISVSHLIVHGNISCTALDVDSCTCDEDISISSYACATLVSCEGIFSACICAVDDLWVYESAFLFSFNGTSIMVADDIICKMTLSFSRRLVAGGNVSCDNIKLTSQDAKISILGKLKSVNINIG